jgi:hypothetical protein
MAEQHIISSTEAKNNAIRRIQQIPCDGNMEVVIRSAGSKSGRQRGLQWLWYEDVAKSGKGGEHEDSKEGVHLVSKYRFAVPIFIRDDPFFADLYAQWVDKYGKDRERMLWFVDTQVHTEKFNTAQTAEYLTLYQNHYTERGFNSTDPDRQLLEIDNV